MVNLQCLSITINFTRCEKSFNAVVDLRYCPEREVQVQGQTSVHNVTIAVCVNHCGFSAPTMAIKLGKDNMGGTWVYVNEVQQSFSETLITTPDINVIKDFASLSYTVDSDVKYHMQEDGTYPPSYINSKSFAVFFFLPFSLSSLFYFFFSFFFSFFLFLSFFLSPFLSFSLSFFLIAT